MGWYYNVLHIAWLNTHFRVLLNVKTFRNFALIRLADKLFFVCV